MLKKHYKKILAVFLIAVLAIGAVFLSKPIESKAATSWGGTGNWRGCIISNYVSYDANNTTAYLMVTMRIKNYNGKTLSSATYTLYHGSTKVGSKKMDIADKKDSYQDVTFTLATISRTHATQSPSYSGFSITYNSSNKYSTAGTIYFSVAAKPSYTISYNANGGNTTPGNQTKWYGEAITTAGAITKTGYDFKGWLWNNSGSPVGASTSWNGANSGGTFYASWAPTNYAINYDLVGGSADNPESYTVETDTFTLNAPTRPGYIFRGWSGTDIDGLADEVTIEKGSLGAREYTANWIPDTLSYRAMFSVGKSKDSAPSEGSTTQSTSNDYGRLANVKGEGFQYEVFQGKVPDGVANSEKSLKGDSFALSRSRSFRPRFPEYYHFTGPDGESEY